MAINIAQGAEQMCRLAICPVTHVGHLPPELLVEIFEIYSIATLGDGLQKVMDYHSPSESEILAAVFAIIQTCSLWRSVAAGCTGFWSFIDLDHDSDVLNWLLERGGTLPLRVFLGHVNDGDHNFIPSLESLRGHALRIRHIGSLSRTFFDHCDVLIYLMDVMNTSGSCGLQTYSADSDQCNIIRGTPTTSVLAASASTLQTLSLRLTRLSCADMPCFLNLRALSLMSVELEGVYIQRVLKDIGQSSPHLHTLHLIDVPVSLQQSGTKIHFPSLKSLVVSLDIVLIEVLVNALVIPLDCRRFWTCENMMSTSVSIATWPAYLDKCLSLFTGAMSGHGLSQDWEQEDAACQIFTFRSLYITKGLDNMVRLTAYDCVHNPPQEQDTAHPSEWRGLCDFAEKQAPLSITLFIPHRYGSDGYGSDDEYRMLNKTLARKLFPLIGAGVETLSVDNDLFVGNPFEVRALLLNLASLRYLRVHTRGRSSVGPCPEYNYYSFSELPRTEIWELKALAPALTPWGEGNLILVAPRLSTLEIGRVFTAYRSEASRERYRKELPKVVEGLKTMVAGRRKAGWHLDHLWINGNSNTRVDLLLHPHEEWCDFWSSLDTKPS